MAGARRRGPGRGGRRGASHPPFRVDTAPPPASYRISPSTLALLLDALAVLLVLAAVALAAAEAMRLLSRRRPAVEVDDLTRALRLARGAGARPAPDRRRAAAFLARVLRGRDPDLAERAGDLAWARPQPAGSAVTELADEIERQVSR